MVSMLAVVENVIPLEIKRIKLSQYCMLWIIAQFKPELIITYSFYSLS